MKNSEKQSQASKTNIDWFDIISDKRIQSIKSAIYARLSDELEIEGILTYQDQNIQHAIDFLTPKEIEDLIQEIKTDRNQDQIEIVRYYWKNKEHGYLLYVLYKDDQNFLVLFLNSHISYTQARQKVYKFISYLKEIAEAIYRESTKELIQDDSPQSSYTTILSEPTNPENPENNQEEHSQLDLETTVPHKKIQTTSNTVIEEAPQTPASHRPKQSPSTSHVIENLENKNQISINKFSFNKKHTNQSASQPEKIQTAEHQPQPQTPSSEEINLDQPIRTPQSNQSQPEEEFDPIIWETGKVEGIDASEPLFDDVPVGNPQQNQPASIPEELEHTNHIPKDWLPEKDSTFARNEFISNLLDDATPQQRVISLKNNLKHHSTHTHPKTNVEQYRNESGAKYNLQYNVLLVTRYPDQIIDQSLYHLITDAIKHIAIAFNWRILEVKNHKFAFSILAEVEPHTSPKRFITTISKYTSLNIFENSNNLRKNYIAKKFWAEDYLLENQSDIFTQNLIEEFIDLVRSRQGL